MKGRFKLKKVLFMVLAVMVMMVIFMPVALADDGEDVSTDISPVVYALIPALYVVGVAMKKTPKLPDWLIPWLLLPLGILGGGFIIGWNVTGIIQGVLCTGMTVYGNQLFKQSANGLNGDT
jgi:hypothetical protein